MPCHIVDKLSDFLIFSILLKLRSTQLKAAHFLYGKPAVMFFLEIDFLKLFSTLVSIDLSQIKHLD